MKFKNYLSNLSYKLTDGQIDRRQFVMSALAAGVALPSALGMADMAAAATPKKGGRLRIGVTGGATTDTLDPGQILDMYMINVQFGQTRNNLTVVDRMDCFNLSSPKSGTHLRMLVFGPLKFAAVLNFTMAKH